MSIFSIPAPLEQDSDSVVTALETAAVFANRGDATEALRWLKRAAESAGDTGDDVRTLTLARSAADLTNHIQTLASAAPEAGQAPQTSGQTPPPAARSIPQAAARFAVPQAGPRSFTPQVPLSGAAHASTAARTTPIALTGTPGSIQSASQTPRPAAPSAATRTPQPPAAALVSNHASAIPTVAISGAPNDAGANNATSNAGANNGAASNAGTNNAAQGSQGSARWLPKPPTRSAVERATSRPPPPSSRPFTTPTPPPVEVRPLAPRDALPNSIPPTARESAVPVRDTLGPSRDSLTPVRDTLTSPISAHLIHSLSTPSVPAVGLTSSERRSVGLEPARGARSERAHDLPRLRQAARVSIVPSSTERGLYLVRLLEDGKSAPEDSAEGLLVLVDPNAAVFSR